MRKSKAEAHRRIIESLHSVGFSQAEMQRVLGISRTPEFERVIKEIQSRQPVSLTKREAFAKQVELFGRLSAISLGRMSEEQELVSNILKDRIGLETFAFLDGAEALADSLIDLDIPDQSDGYYKLLQCLGRYSRFAVSQGYWLDLLERGVFPESDSSLRHDMVRYLDKCCRSHVRPSYPVNAQEVIDRLLDSLSERRADVLRRRFGLNREAESFMVVGLAYGVTRERIRQIENMALRQLMSGERRIILRHLFFVSPASRHVISDAAVQAAFEKLNNSA